MNADLTAKKRKSNTGKFEKFQSHEANELSQVTYLWRIMLLILGNIGNDIILSMIFLKESNLLGKIESVQSLNKIRLYVHSTNVVI